MTTTPTFWSNGTITFDQNLLQSFFGPKITALADDSFTVVWEDGTDLFGRHFDALGSLTTGNFLSDLSSNITKPIFNPVLMQQANGSMVLEYGLEFDNSPLDRDVFWHSVSSDFAADHNASAIDNSGADEIFLNATSHSDGVGHFGTVVAYRYNVGMIDNLVLRFVSSSGIQASNQIFITEADPGALIPPALVGRHTGQVIVAYSRIAGGVGFHMETLNNDGSTLDSGEVVVSTSGAFPDVTALQGAFTGVHVVTWQDSGGIYFRRYSTTVALDANPVLIANSGGLLSHVTPLKDGGFIIVWGQAFGTESDNSADFDLAIQRFDGSGNAIGDRVFIDEPGDQGPFDVSVTTLADGRVTIAFSNETGDATDLHKLDYVILDPRDTTINGSANADTIVGRLDASTINGFGGSDHLIGMKANDALNGGDGDDTLTGGKGKDKLLGGLNDDTFDFNSVKDSRTTNSDVIKDFRTGSDLDFIDLSDIDAKSGGADNKFTFIGTQGFHHKAGELHYFKQNLAGTAHDKTFVQGDVNGDGTADFQIVLIGLHALKGGDFIL